MKILYATDGSQAADRAKKVMTKLFRRDGVKVRVVSVTHSWSFDPDHVFLELDPIAERRGDSHEIVDSAAEELEEAGFETSTAVLEGHPGHELARLARAGYDLVVVGAGSHSWLDRRLLGSVSTYLLHEAPCSVMVVHDAPKNNDREGRVVVGADGSNTSDETVRMLGHLLDAEHCEIEVISVVPYQFPVVAPILAGSAGPEEKLLARAETEFVRQANGLVQSASEIFRERGFKTTMRVERGSATAVLLDEVRETKADLICVGSRGLGPIRRTLLGSVSDQVARLAPATLVGRFWINKI